MSALPNQRIKSALRTILILSLLFSNTWDLRAQCPNILDGGGVPSAAPVWVSCSGANFNLFIQPVDTLFSYSIDWGDASAPSTGDTLLPADFETHLYAATMANYPVTITANCGVINGTVIMEITPSASIQIPVGSPTFGCAPATYAFENASTNVSTNTIFTWDWGDGSPLETYGDTNWGDTLYHMYLPGTVGCDVMITLTADNNCPPTSTNTYFPIQVWEVDDAEITPSATLLCYPDTVVHFDNTTTKNCLANGNTSQRYEYWNFGNYWGMGSDSIIPWQPWDPPARPGYDIAYPGLGTYNIMLIDSSYCGLDTAYATITIVSDPIAILSPNPDTICVGQSITFSNSSIGANTYDWNFGDGGGWNSTGGGSQTNTYNTAGSFTANLVASIAGAMGCIDTAGVQVEVLPSPQAIFSTSGNTGCDSLDVTFTDASVSAVAWDWNFGNGDTSTSATPPIISYNSPGTYTVQLVVTSLNGCQDTTTATINVYETPTVVFTAPNVCVNQTTVFTDGSTSGVQPITSWSWDFGDGNTSTVQNPSNTYLTAGPKNVILMVSTGPCSATDSVTIQADSLPAASISADTTDGCTPLTVVFTNTSAGAVSYQWDFADGGSFSGIDTSHLFINNGTSDTVYLVRMVATTSAGCTDTAFLPITVHPIPLVAFTSNAAPGCSPLQVSFTDASIGVSQYYWDFGDGSIDTVNASPNHAFYNTGFFILVDTVELIGVSAFGCSDSISSLVTIYPSANSVIAVPDTGCSPMTVQFSSTLIGAVLFDWDFGDGSVDSVQSPIHTFVNPSATDTNYTVTLIVTSGFLCVDTSYANILVYAKPTSIFSADTAQGCGPLTINFTNSSIGGVSYQWDFGDGNTLDTSVTTFPYAYTNVGGAVDSNLASLEVTSSNGCMDTMSIPIQVFSSVFASFSQSDTAGCSPLSVSFTDGSTFADLYSWDFGDNSSLDSTSDPGHVFSNSGTVDSTYDVRLIILSNNGCLDSAFAQVLIYPSPTAAFAVTPMSQMFPNATVNVANLSSPGTWNYAWDFGDGAVDSTVGPAAHSYSTWNDYTIELIVYSDECSDTTETIVTVVQPPPISGFALDTNAGCRPVIVTFKDTSLYADSLMWDFGDGTPFYFTSDTQAISHTYYDAGIYVVTLRAFGAGGTFDIGATTVEVYEIPVASFAINPNPAIIYLPDKPIYCVNLSSNATNYQWTFGDGMSSTEESPAHYYTEVGDYDIVLIASNLFGCYDTLIVPAAVAVEEGGEILFPTAFTPNPAGPGDGIYDPNNFNNDIFHPYWDGVDQYLLRIFNRWGELLFETEDIDQGWDGYYRGELVQQDVYAWKANVLFENGEQKTMAGDVTLLR